MQLQFYKYEATGNDFILIDNRSQQFRPDAERIAILCDRHFGIGADGILLLETEENYDFRMIYYNSDGSHATFCGNGGRCITAFAYQLGITGDQCNFVAADGPHSATILEQSGNSKMIELGMRDGEIYENTAEYCYLNTGTYHYVKFVDDPSTVDIVREGSRIRYDTHFEPHGTNVNFVQFDGQSIHVRTYEKGVEAETLSCGTGATASAIAVSLKHGGDDFAVHVSGGKLKVTFKRQGESFVNVKLTGPATLVFAGTIKL